jgi:hypothetical protein
MVTALEALLDDLPVGTVEAPPPALADSFMGSFLRDWRELDTSHHYRERVRPLPCHQAGTVHPSVPCCKETLALVDGGERAMPPTWEDSLVGQLAHCVVQVVMVIEEMRKKNRKDFRKGSVVEQAN